MNTFWLCLPLCRGIRGGVVVSCCRSSFREDPAFGSVSLGWRVPRALVLFRPGCSCGYAPTRLHCLRFRPICQMNSQRLAHY